MRIIDSIIWHWNLLHYFIYLWQKKSYEVLDFFLPTTLFLKIPFVQEFYKRRGINDIQKFIKKTTDGNEMSGMNISWAGIHVGGLLVLLIFSIVNYIQVLVGKSLLPYIWSSQTYIIGFIIILIVSGYIINYCILFKNDRYLIYFKEFNALPKNKKRKYGCNCFLLIVLILIAFIGSFLALFNLT